MELFGSGNYFFSTSLVITGVVFIFALFRGFRYLLQYFRLPRNFVELVEKYLPAAELTVWLLFLIWSVHFFYTKGLLITFLPLLVLLSIVLYLIWYALRDITAGIVFKTSGRFQINDAISVGDVNGKIIEMGQRNLIIENLSGQIISIPYSKVDGIMITKSSPSQSLVSHNFLFQLTIEQEKDVFELIQNLQADILLLPWSSQKKEPIIRIHEETDKTVILAITIYCLEEISFKKTEKFLTNAYHGKVLKTS
ncbi:MAG: mechanosensitive ion channel domain-containing protein [Bacteroidota bacterium]